MITLFNRNNLRPRLSAGLILVATFIILMGCDNTDVPDQEEDLVDIYQEDLSFKVVGYIPWYRFDLVD